MEQVFNWPLVAAAPNVHQKALEKFIDNLPPNQQRVLDCPCGAGSFSVNLEKAGYEAFSLDIYPNDPFLFAPEKRVIADLNEGIPFPDGHFEGLCSIEGIEHLENPSFFLREISRVLKKGGVAVITTPNVNGFYSLKKCLSRGSHNWFEPVSEFEKEHGHLLPIDTVFFRGAARKAGLEVVDVDVNEMAGWYAPTRFREYVRTKLTRKWPEFLRGKIPFYGEVMVYTLRKSVTA